METPRITRSVKQIKEQLDKISEAKEGGGIYHGMSYEDGVEAMYNWLTGETNEPPME